VISVLATGPKVRGYKPGRRLRILRVIKICSTTYFGEAERSAPCSNILGMLKHPSKYNERDTSLGKIHYFLRQFLLLYY
jgi:hypothetical protein